MKQNLKRLPTGIGCLLLSLSACTTKPPSTTTAEAGIRGGSTPSTLNRISGTVYDASVYPKVPFTLTFEVTCTGVDDPTKKAEGQIVGSAYICEVPVGQRYLVAVTADGWLKRVREARPGQSGIDFSLRRRD